MEGNSAMVDILVQAGAVGLALVSITGLIYALRLSFNHLNEISNQLGKITVILEIILKRLERRA